MGLPKIALEEHVASPETVDEAARFIPPDKWPTFKRDLMGVHGQLLSDMDEAGIALTVLSLQAPGIQGILDKRQATEVARRCNDYFAEQVAKNPKRFQAFAALPLQDTEAASAKLTRCVNELGFKGSLANSFSQVGTADVAVYYDLPQYWDFWATVESLDLPFYLHIRDVLPNYRPMLAGHPWFWGPWAFTMDAASHALRLMASGLFDKYPRLKIVLGHLGETLPFVIERVSKWAYMTPRGIPAKRLLRDYFKENFYVTTSGMLCDQSLLNSVLWLGADRVMFSVDYPFENMTESARWLESLSGIGAADLQKIAYGNAAKLLSLGTENSAATSA